MTPDEPPRIGRPMIRATWHPCADCAAGFESATDLAKHRGHAHDFQVERIGLISAYWKCENCGERLPFGEGELEAALSSACPDRAQETPQPENEG